jgi:hypothetical protein
MSAKFLQMTHPLQTENVTGSVTVTKTNKINHQVNNNQPLISFVDNDLWDPLIRGSITQDQQVRDTKNFIYEWNIVASITLPLLTCH